MLSTGQLAKETFLVGTLKIGLPTADVYSDGVLMFKLYRGFPHHPDCDIWDGWKIMNETCLAGIPDEQLQYENHPTWATMLVVPFLLNYIASWYTWYRIAQRKRKKFTWLACLLGLYPQLRAANIIRELWKEPNKGLAKKKKFDRELCETEVFLEAVPTTFILTFIIARFDSNMRNRRAAFQLEPDEQTDLFLITYLTSIITASLGMAKVLKVKS